MSGSTSAESDRWRDIQLAQKTENKHNWDYR